MLYKTDIANMALGRLGVSNTISDVSSDPSTAAKIIRRHFRSSLDELLEQHHWIFARRTVQLVLQANNPEYLWSYSYHHPASALVIRQVAYNGQFLNNLELYPDQKEPFLEIYSGGSQLIYSNVKSAYAEYTERVSEDMLFPNHFGRGLAAQLSMDIAPSLITNNYPKIRDSLNASAFNDISKAIANDLNKMPQAENADSSLVRVRY